MTATKTYVIESATDDPQALLRDLTALEMRANAMGLFPAARAMNNAKNAIGWQIAGDIAQADAASTRRE
jgi:3-hydroxy-3-methylglutaryl CoA synthase